MFPIFQNDNTMIWKSFQERSLNERLKIDHFTTKRKLIPGYVA
jgi:hypothetical protein